MLENEKIEQREVSAKEIWQKNGRVKSENGILMVMGMEMGKMGEKEGLKMKTKGGLGLK